MATAALAPRGQRWADGGAGDGLAGVIGSLLRDALAGGCAHVETQSGVVRPCVPGVEPRYQGLVEHAGGWAPVGETVLYWLEDRRPPGEPGAFGLAGAELVGRVKAARAELAGHSDRRLLQAALEAGVVVGDRRYPGRWSQLVKIAGKARRVVV